MLTPVASAAQAQCCEGDHLQQRTHPQAAIIATGSASFDLTRNLRKEISKTARYYFFDNGVRNSLIQNFHRLALRNDVGALWENWFISERTKFNHNRRRMVNAYFWRTYGGAEIDYLEEEGGKLAGFECKWSEETWRHPAAFLEADPGSDLRVVNKNNYVEFLA